MRCLRYGDAAVLLEDDDPELLRRHYAGLRRALPDGVLELVPAARTILVKAGEGIDLGALAQAVLAVPPADAEATRDGEVELEVRYDGDDLEQVAELTGLTPAGVVEAHTGQVWTVAFCGFAPGFGYLVGTDDRLTVPRRDSPRTRVPAGSVALAGPYTGVYPSASPGGWQLIGRTDRTIWDLGQDPPALLRPGTRVRFTAT
jgi:KipI family sensor histidine kinase inhibitor